MMTTTAKISAGDEARREVTVGEDLASHNYYREPIDPPRNWPTLGEAAFGGPVGELVLAGAPYTEADPSAVLVQLLVMAGVLIGRKPYLSISGEHYHANLMCILLGATGSGRKGTAGNEARRLLADKGAIVEIGGLASGEALIDALAPMPSATALIVEEEYSRWLKAAGRTGSTLGETARVLYDGKPLIRRTTEHGEQRVEGYHVSVIGHCTPDEFVATLSDIDQSNGAANRLLIIPVASRQLVIFNDDDGTVTIPAPTLAGKRTLAQIALKASRRERVKWSKTAWERARDLYTSRCMYHPSPLLARQWTNFGRLVLIYSLLDETERIELRHVEAAEAIIRFSRAGVQQIFKQAPRPALVDDILRRIRSRGVTGLTVTELTREFSNHMEASKRNAILGGLLNDRLIRKERRLTTGRPAEWLVASEFLDLIGDAPGAKEAH